MNNLFNIAFLISSFLLILCLIILSVEILLRIIVFFKKIFFYQNIQRKDFISKEYHTYLHWVENLDKPIFKYLPIGIRFFNENNEILNNYVKNNSMGFRTYEFTKKKEDELRIVLLGGSTAWGAGSSSNETNIAGYLEKIINNNKKLLGSKTHAKVFNLSQVLSTITQDILSLIFHVNELEPDIVITFAGWNELITSYKLDERILNKYKLFYLSEMENWEPTQLPKIKKKIIKNLIGEWIIDNIQIFKIFSNKKKIYLAPNIKILDHTDHVSKNLKLNSMIVVRNYNIIEKISKGFNFTVIHFLQPNLYRKLLLSKSEIKILELYNEYRPIHGGKKIANFLENTNIYQYICDESSKTSLNVVSLLDIFNKEKESIYYTLVHFNDLGYRLTAEIIYKNLLVNQNNYSKKNNV